MAYTVSRPSQAPAAAVTYNAAAASDTFAWEQGIMLHIKTTGTGTTVAVTCPNACSFGVTNSAHNLSVVIGAVTTDRLLGPIPEYLKDPATGLCTVTTTVQTGVSIAVVAK
jgi:hypothetical protein